MLGKRNFVERSGVKVSDFENSVKKRLAHLERKAGEVKKPHINLTPLVERIESLEKTFVGYREQLAAVPKNGDATNHLRLEKMEEQLESMKVALVKLPPNGGLVVKVSSVERGLCELEKKVERFGEILANLAGLSGEEGRIKVLEKRADKTDEKLDKLASIHYKLLALGTAGAFVGGLAATALKYLF